MSDLVPIVRLVLVANKDVILEQSLGPQRPTLDDGFGGWTTVDRIQQTQVTEWNTVPPMTATLQLLFDGRNTGHSQSARIAYLKRHFAPPAAGRRPPPFRVVGAYPLPITTHWVCNGLKEAPDDDLVVVRRADREPLLSLVTLTLLEYQPPTSVITTGAARSKSTGAKTKTYTVRHGDTLSSIAAKQLGDHRKATAIAKLNGIRNGKALKAGQKLKLPL